MRRALAAIVLVGCAARQRVADDGLPGGWRYEVSVDAELTLMTVRFCPDRPYDGTLELASPPGYRALVPVGASGDESRLDIGNGPIAVHLRNTGDCAVYGVDLSSRPTGRHFAGTPGQTVILSMSHWLLRPSVWQAGATARARFTLPPGITASVPWSGDANGYTLDSGTFWWEGTLLLGHLAPERVEAHGATFDVVRADPSAGPPPAVVARWMTATARATAMLYGRFPTGHVQIALVPYDGQDPVGFGLARRGGGEAITLLVNPNAPPDALERDWTAIHESVHLAHPVMDDVDAWFSEGAATYYQEVLRARAGLISEREAWGGLCDGLARGRAGTHTRSLREDSAGMHRGGGYVRVYWAGVAIMLELDVALRRHDPAHGSLDAALQSLQREAESQPLRSWNVAEASAVIDRAAGFEVWNSVVEPRLSQTGFPDVAPTLEALGVRCEASGATLRDDAPEVGVRRAITAPR